MNIMFKNTHNIENNKLQRNPQLQRTNFSSFNNSNGERPLELKSNQDLSFKGLSSAQKKAAITVAEAVKTFGEDFGESAGKYFREVIEKESKLAKPGLKINPDGTITFVEKNLGQKVFEIVSYPVVQMPFDFANALVGGMKRVPGFKNLASKLDTEFLKEKRAIGNSKSQVASVKHYCELLGKGKEYKRLTEGQKRLAPLMPSYNAESERSLNRLVTGLIPAFFLANDAYNLSMYMNNNKDVAKKEKKRRFNQEVGRILTTTAATYGVMSLFAKQCNRSIGLTAALTSGIVLVSEILGRKLAGNPVLPVNVRTAKEYAQQRTKSNQPENTQNKNHAGIQQKETTKKGGLTLNNILKTIGGLMVLGFALEKVASTKILKSKIGDFKKWYEKLYTKDFIISRNEFVKINKKLRTNGFSEIADFGEELVKKQQGQNIKLYTVKDKPKFILIHQVLTFPIRFTWSVLMLPYKKLVKPLVKVIKKEVKPIEEIKPKKILQDSIQFLQKIQDKPDAEFTKKVNQALLSSFDNLTKSSYDNSDLNVIVKTAQSAVTTGFLVADNYNMVMIESQGQNKDLAEQKAKERTMQRGARLTYEAFIIKMVNDIFSGPCNSSLLAALGLAGGLRVITEMVERKAVGLPIKESTQEQIKEDEKIHLSATGVKGSYFRAMAKLSGKKSFTEKKENERKS